MVHMEDKSSPQNLLLSSLVKFYSHPPNLNRLLPIVNQTSRLSLRVVDFFCTNYSKKNNVFINNLSVYESYRVQLKAHRKQSFDCFCRQNKVVFEIGGCVLYTSIAQLLFMKWMIENHILDYVESNYDVIEKDMLNALDRRKKEKQVNGLPLNAKTTSPVLYVTKSIKKREGTITMQFK